MSSTAAKLQPIQRRSIAAWVLYDAANSAFPLVMQTAIFVLYFKAVIVGSDRTGLGDLLWGIAISGSAAFVAITSPFFGAIADAHTARKRFLLAYTVVAVVATAMLGFTGPGTIVYAMVFFMIANAGFEGGMVFYGSLLPSVAPPERTGRISGIGWGLGYFGGLACLILTMGLATQGRVPLVTVIVAAWFAVLSIPTFLFVKERQEPNRTTTGRPLHDLVETLRLAWRQPGLRRFLIAYFIYNDAIITIFSFAAPFATDELGYTMKEVIMLVAAIQLTGAAGALLFGFIADRVGHARTIVITLSIWVAVTFSAFLTARDLPLWQQDAQRAYDAEVTRVVAELNAGRPARPAQDGDDGSGAVTNGLDGALHAAALAVELRSLELAPPPSPLRKWVFAFLGLLVGFTMGATQASSRAFLASVVPDQMSGRFFGLYAVAGRFSAVIGPFLFGLISFATGSKAWSVLMLAFMFTAGLLIMRRVDDSRIREDLHATIPPAAP